MQQHDMLATIVEYEDDPDMAQRRLNFPQLVSVTEAAKLVGVNRATVHRWVKSGKLDAMSVGNMSLLVRDDVLKLAQERKGKAFAKWSGVLATRHGPGGEDITVRFEETMDPKLFYMTYIAPNGQELVAECRFNEDPDRWIKAVKDSEANQM